jgi:hypothetical protein
MKASLFALALRLVWIPFLAGCRKDILDYAPGSSFQNEAAISKHKTHVRPLTASIDVYNIYTSDFVNGEAYHPPYLPGYMAGVGEGNNTLLSKFYSYSHFHFYYDATGAQVTYSVPLTDDCYNQIKLYFTEAELTGNSQPVLTSSAIL